MPRPTQNENKILHDVFEKGDAWFRTGDLMRKDERGYFYFVDRVGDTFRWKGENVSTSEVAEAINAFPGIADANVYGVTVAGRDGRAGMAAIVCDGQCDLARAARASRQRTCRTMRGRCSCASKPRSRSPARSSRRRSIWCARASTRRRPAIRSISTTRRRKAFVLLDPALYRRIESGEVRL